MMAALFFPRAVLSADIIAFTGISFVQPDFKKHIRHFFCIASFMGYEFVIFSPADPWPFDRG